ncbi:hypothetical protein RB595_008498 [Gaeumannomyces hyphopodioides]
MGAEKQDVPPLEAGGVSAAAPPPNAATESSSNDGEKAQAKGDDKAAAATSASARPEREATFKDYLRVFSYAQSFDYVLIVSAALAAVGAGTTMPLMNVVFGRLVDSFTDFNFQDPTVREKFEGTLNRLALYIFILFLARFVLNYISKFCFRLIGIRMSAEVRLDYLNSLFKQTIHVLDSMPSGAAAGTITSTANTLQLGISEKLGTLVEYLTMLIASIIIAFTWSWLLTLVCMSVMLFIAITVSILLPFIIKGQSRQTRAETKANSVASEAFSSIRMVTACGAEERLAARYAEWAHKARQFGQTTTPLLSTQFALIFFAIYAAWALTFWYGTRMLVEGRIGSIGAIIIVLMSVMVMVISFERMSSPLIAVAKAMVAACEFFIVIDAPQPDPGHLKEPDVTASADISFSDVDFAYPSRPNVKVLDNLSMTFPAGKVTAIVGPSGSGKSTIVGLIERWYDLKNGQHVLEKAIEKDKNKEAKEKKKAKKAEKAKKNGGSPLPEDSDDEDEEGEAGSGLLGSTTGPPVQLKGSISTCGHELHEINVKWWRSQIGLVQQEPFLFNDTIEKNVMYGLIGSEFEDAPEERKKELVREACAEAFADEFIDKLPDGYQTLVGDSGTKLSGGQRQRIAIARSIIKRPKILILDEATSAIDVRGERIVQQALERVSRNRTTITIAHRLSTIKTADKICVMKKGRCVEEGTHDSLLQDPTGVYYGLVHAQQLSLGDENDDDSDGPAGESLGETMARTKSAAVSEAEASAVAGWRDRGTINSFGRLLAEQKSRLPLYVISVLAAMMAGSGIPLQAYLFAKTIAVFQLPMSEISREGSFLSLMWFVLALGVGIAYFTLGYSSIYLQHYICAVYRQQYFRAILYQRIPYYDEEPNSTGSLTARVAGDPKQLEELLGINMTMVYTSVFNLIGAFAISFAFSWKLALVAIFVTMPIGLSAGYFRVKYEIEFEKMYAAVFAESSKWASESIGAFRTVTALTLEDPICTRYSDLLRSHVDGANKKARYTTLIFALSDSVSLACQALIFWYGGRLLLSGEISMTQFFVCYMAVIQGAESAGSGLSFGPNAAQATSAANRILGARETAQKDLSAVEGQKSVPDADQGIGIEFEDVYFKYPTRDVSIFKGLNLSIPKGQFVALVGASGSGKTSIVSLLERFYEPQRGRILFNGVAASDINVFEYRRHMSLVAQEPTLFQGSIRDNILIGIEDPATVSDEQLHAVCRDASIHDFIASLPEGYNTDIGSRGVSLSGGQKQRLAIARALVRDPQVLLLDEATSSLDSDTEKLIQATFERVAKGRTTIAVAHRLSTIQKADVIYVLGEGKVLESGSHAELLKKRGVYWHMCQSQALDR